MTHDLQAQAAYDQRISVGFGSWGSSPPKFRIYSPENRLYIGSYCALGYDVTIFAGGTHPYKLLTQHHLKLLFGLETTEQWTDGSPSRYDVTKIGSDVWIGEGAVIMSGVSIGHGAVVGAHAVVDQDVPPFAIVAGNRARVLKSRFSEEVGYRLGQLAWWDWHPDRVKAAAHIISSKDIDGLENYAREHDGHLRTPIPTHDEPPAVKMSEVQEQPHHSNEANPKKTTRPRSPRSKSTKAPNGTP
ncbi:CatB-related O-acetyltransferase [Sphingomonas sp. PAMC 26605]|uniref:CatB-related O-acetyltransferase n=1 Tax=Sphingomonas sp. PAMC 26605 TaxID=1112214 RepID=UPI0009DAE42E|nr:CatB-related O-acetyltransferase [Sphingomonas sp. PAMC 26605]